MSGFNPLSLDLQARAESGTVIELEHPGDGTPIIDPATNKPVSITLRGKDSPQVVAVTNKQHDVAQDRIRKRKPYKSAEQTRRDNVEVLVAATISWSGIAGADGEPLECNRDNARKLYEDMNASWLVEQLAAALEDRERFFPSGSKS